MSTERPPGPQCPARRGDAGFTLIELVVATAVLLLAVMLACDLLDESGRLLHHSVRRARDPWTLIAAELLRNDLRAGAVRPPFPPGHSPGQFVEGYTLKLSAPGGGEVWWGRNGRNELVRKIGGNSYTYIHDVQRFRWRTFPHNDAVEVWVRYHVSSPYLRQLAGRLPRADAGEDVDLHVLMVARGGGAREW